MIKDRLVYLFSVILTLVTSECSYRAAALQFTPQTAWNLNAQQYIDLNLDGAIPFIKNASIQGADIVLLPEEIFWGPGLVDIDDPSLSYAEKRAVALSYAEYLPKNGTIPCDDNSNTPFSIATKLSCMARSARIYVAANFLTLAQCSTEPGCPVDGVFNYNTNIVLDKEGRLVAIYHKHHLYGTSPLINPAQSSEPPVTFWLSVDKAEENCPSSVKVGVLICWDLAYGTPWNATSLQEYGVHDLIFSTDWGAYPPLASPGMWQQGFAIANKVNLIAANNGASHNQPNIGDGGNGGGIYAEGNVLTEVYDQEKDLNVLLIADVPLETRTKDHSNIQRRFVNEILWSTKQCTLTSGPDLNNETFSGTCDITTSPGSWHLSAKNKAIQCSANLNVIGDVSVALIAVHQTMTFPHTPDLFKVSSCLLIPCNDNGVCFNTWQQNSLFTDVRIEATSDIVVGEYVWMFPMAASANEGVVSLVNVNTGNGSQFKMSNDGLESVFLLSEAVVSASIFGVRRP